MESACWDSNTRTDIHICVTLGKFLKPSDFSFLIWPHLDGFGQWGGGVLPFKGSFLLFKIELVLGFSPNPNPLPAANVPG